MKYIAFHESLEGFLSLYNRTDTEETGASTDFRLKMQNSKNKILPLLRLQSGKGFALWFVAVEELVNQIQIKMEVWTEVVSVGCGNFPSFLDEANQGGPTRKC